MKKTLLLLPVFLLATLMLWAENSPSSVLPIVQPGISNQFTPFFSIAATRDPAYPLPYITDFSSEVIPEGWTQTSDNGLPEDRWSLGSGFILCYGTPGIGTTRLISPPLDTSGLSDLAVSSAVYFFPFGPDITFKLQYSHDYENWYDANWSISGSEFYSFMTDAVIGINAPVTYLAWALTGNQIHLDVVGLFQVFIHEFLPPTIDIDNSGLISWGTANAPSYIILSADTPNGVYTPVAHVTDTSWQIPMESAQQFFRVASSTEIIYTWKSVSDYLKHDAEDYRAIIQQGK